VAVEVVEVALVAGEEVFDAGFEVLPRCWVVERTFARLGRCRRHAKDFERAIESAIAWSSSPSSDASPAAWRGREAGAPFRVRLLGSSCQHWLIIGAIGPGGRPHSKGLPDPAFSGPSGLLRRYRAEGALQQKVGTGFCVWSATNKKASPRGACSITPASDCVSSCRTQGEASRPDALRLQLRARRFGKGARRGQRGGGCAAVISPGCHEDARGRRVRAVGGDCASPRPCSSRRSRRRRVGGMP
jgi:hypothetical protein